MRFAPKREYFIPKHYVLLFKAEDLGIEVWGDDDRSAIAFHGKAQRPDWHIGFHSAERRQQRITEYVAAIQAHADKKAADRKARSEWQHGIKVGDIFRTSWGYDQTNIEFFEVTKVMGKSVEIREIAQDREETAWCQGNCVPLAGRYTGKPRVKIPQRGYKGEPTISIYSFASATPFKPVAVVSGKPIFLESHWTAYA